MEFAARGTRVLAVDNISLSIEAGEVLGFIGPNGAGKTTTMHALLGFIAPTSGSARIFGMNSQNIEARKRLGYLPEQPHTYRFLTGYELVSMTGRLFGMSGRKLRKRVDEVLEMTDIAFAAKRRTSDYSRGMLQRICLAQALVNDPDLLILDEPTGGLDPIARARVRDLILRLKNEGKTVFFSSHELSEVERVCDSIAILYRGRLLKAGRTADVLRGAGGSLERFFLDLVDTGGAR